MSEQNVQPARWLADPTGRHELRYWDGTRWTAHVSDGGAISVDDPATDRAGGIATRATAATTAATAAVDLDDDAPTAAFDPFLDDEHDSATVAMPVGAGVGAGVGVVVGAAGGMPPGPATNGLGSQVGYVVPGAILPADPVPGELTSLGTLFGPGDLRLDEDRPQRPQRPNDPGLRNRMPLLVGGLVVCAVIGTITGIVAFSGLPDSGTDAARVVASPSASTEEPAEVLETPVDEETLPGPIISTPVETPTDPMGEPSLEPPSLSPTTKTTKPKPKPSATATPTPTVTRPTQTNQLRRYQSCQSMRRDYPNGVGVPGARDEGSRRPETNFTVNPALYAVNSWLDRDSDGIVCEPKG